MANGSQLTGLCLI